MAGHGAGCRRQLVPVAADAAVFFRRADKFESVFNVANCNRCAVYDRTRLRSLSGCGGGRIVPMEAPRYPRASPRADDDLLSGSTACSWGTPNRWFIDLHQFNRQTFAYII